MATNFFPSRKRHCPDCLQRTVTVDEQEVTEYYHQYVLLQTFYQRNLKPAFRVGMTLIALARQLYAAWVNTGRILPWLEPQPPDTS